MSRGQKYLLILVIAVILIPVCLKIGVPIYQEKKAERLAQEREQRDEDYSKVETCFSVVGDPNESRVYCRLTTSEEREEYWEAFVENPYTEKRVEWLNQYMEAEKIVHPDMPYETVTVEQLKTEPEELGDMLENAAECLRNGGIYPSVHHLDDLAQFNGQDKETMELLGYTDLAQNFTYDYDYFDEVFLQIPGLQETLDNFNQYAHETYPNLAEEAIVPTYLETYYLNEEWTEAYDTSLEEAKVAWQDFTLETVQKDSENVYDWLIELKNREEEKGGSWEAVVQACRAM